MGKKPFPARDTVRMKNCVSCREKINGRRRRSRS
jgi:hypothetical protein